MNTTNIETLIATRRDLVRAVDNTDCDAFPGSRAYSVRSRALRALAEFDREHPEVLAESNRRHAAEVLGDKDVLGL